MQHFTASDGARIAYSDAGEGRPLLLLHGLMAHSEFFEKQQELSDRFRLITLDLRGHGQSGGEAASVEQLARDVSEFLALRDLQDAIVVGWSLGASVLWHVLCGPETSRVAGAVIVDMTPRVLNEGGWELGLSREICDARRTAIRDDFQTLALNAGHAIFAQPVRDDLRETAEWSGRQFAANDPAAIGALWESLVAQDFRAALRRIEQPTLVIHGAHSQLYGSDTADHIVAALPNARAVQFDRSGHAPHMEEPEHFNRLIRDFAAGLSPARKAQTTA